MELKMRWRGSRVCLDERYAMTLDSKLENSPVNHRQVYCSLTQLSEPELVRLLQSVKALRKDLQPIHSTKGEPVEAVSVTQNLLKIWSDELERLMALKQAKETYSRLRNWDNEGGAVDHAPKRRLLTVTAN